VDLGDPAIADHHENDRFIARVCTEAERARVTAAEDPKRLLWTLFAAKEAAYKVAAKLGRAPGFAHRSFEVAADLTSVRYGDLDLHLSVDVTDGWVHAIASTGAEPVTAAAMTAPPGEHPSIAARRLLCEAVAEQIKCSPAELQVVRERVPGSWDGFGPPLVHRAGEPVDVDVSLSHDGRFVAFAVSSPR